MASLTQQFVRNPSIAASRGPIEKTEPWHLFSITAILFGIQSTAGVAISDTIVVPFVISAFFAAISYIFFATKINIDNSKPILIYLFLVILVNALSYDNAYSSLYFIGPLQLFYSIFLCTGAYLIIRDITLAILQKWCLAITFAITILSVAELNGSVSAAFNSVTDFLTANPALGTFVASDARELTLYGAVRSKVFATEPSHAALTLMALGFGFFWTKPRFKLVAAWMAMIVICIWTIRSPVLAVVLLLGPASSLMIKETKSRGVQLLIGMILLLVFAFVIADYIMAIFGTRIEADGSGDGSFDMRFTVPFQFVRDFFPGHLLFGVGVVGDFDMLTYEILAAYHERGMLFIDYNNASSSLSNNLAQHFVSFGLIFGIATLVSLVFVVRMRSRWAWAIICVECLTIWMFLGGYVSARVWVLCALMVAIARRAEYEEATFLRPVGGTMRVAP